MCIGCGGCELGRHFERVVGVAAVAARVAGDHLQRLVVGCKPERAQAAFLIGQRSFEQRDDLILFERLEHIDPAAGEQSRNHFEGGVLGGGADQPDGAALDVRQEGVLLGLVEAVNLVDEQDRPRVQIGGFGRVGHHLLDLFNAAHDGRELDEAGLRGFGYDLGQSGFAHSGRAPEDHRAGVVALDLHAQGLAGTDQMLLPHEFFQTAGPHALSERRRCHCVGRFFGRVQGPGERLIGLAVEEAHRLAPRCSAGPPASADRCCAAS